MKIRFAINRTTRHRELLVLSRKGEELNPHQAAWLERLNHENFLRVSYDVPDESGRTTIAYDVNGLVTFGRYIRKYTLSGDDLVGMLTDLACAYGNCTSGQNRRFWQQSMLFDKRFVFADKDAKLRFVFIPLDGLPFTVENSPLVLLQLLGDTRKVKYATPNDYSLARDLGSYALNERGTFSFNSYRAFLRNECGIEIDPDGTIRGGVANREKPVLDSKRELQPREVQPVERPSRTKNVQGGTGSPRRYRLHRVSTGETYDIAEAQQVILGRGSGCDPQLLGNPKVSRKHASILVQDDSMIIVDLGSANGTFVNSTKLPQHQPIRVRVGQEFSLATETLRVEMG